MYPTTDSPGYVSVCLSYSIGKYLRPVAIFVQVRTHLASLGLGFRVELASAAPGEGGTNMTVPSAYGI